MKARSSQARPAQPRPRFRSLGLERLESRVVLDGGVRAFVSGGNLRIVGDVQANEIQIEQSSMRSFRVSSRDGTTRINGQTDSQTFFGVRGDVDISLGRGNDVVEITGTAADAVTVSDRLIINTGSGRDQVLLTEVHAIGLHINTGNQDDIINVGSDGAEGGLEITKEAVILTGSGQDDASISNSLFKRFVNLNMGNNDDETTMQNVTVRRRSVIHGGSGFDTLNREANRGKLKFLSYERVNNTVESPAPIPPVARNDTATVIRGSSVTIDLAANDTPAGTIDPASIVITQPPTHGTVTVNNNGTVTYINNGDVASTDTLQYTIDDQDGTTSNAATVTITVNEPTTLTAFNDRASLTEDATPNTVSGNALTNDAQAASATVTAVNSTAANVGQPVAGAQGHGTFVINANGQFTYTLNNGDSAVNALNAGQTLIDTATYTITSGSSTSTATITVTINGHTDTALNAVDDLSSIAEDATPNNITGVNVLTNDTNAAGNKTVTAVNGAAGSVGQSVQGQFGTFNIASNGDLTYTLDNNNTTVNGLSTGQTLLDVMPYTASDGTTSSTAQVRITIQGHTD
jgi:VCBS repeat-containing protein